MFLDDDVSGTKCPQCQGRTTFIGKVRVTLNLQDCPEDNADRFDCESGHTTLVIKTERIES